MPELKLYVATSSGGPTKIGISKNPQKRMLAMDLCRQGRRAVLEHVEHIPPGMSAYDVERLAHGIVHAFRDSTYGTEWFNITAEQAIEAVQRALDMANSDTHVVGWSVRLAVSLKVKSLLQRVADEDEVEIEELVASILRDYAATRSTS